MGACNEIIGTGGARCLAWELDLASAVRVFIDKFGYLIETVLEYLLGIHVGAGVGYVVGKFSGYIYSEYFTPVFSSESIVQLWLAPYRYAIYGAVIGSFVGVLAITILSMRRNIYCENVEIKD